MPDSFTTTPRPHVSCSATGAGALLGVFGGPPLAPTLTLPVAERVRAALMHASDSRVPWQISGKDERGEPRRGHLHLFILPFASTGQTSLDRVLLWARGGLEDRTLAVLERLRERSGWISLRGGPRLRLELLAVGSHAQLGAEPLARVLGRSRRWRSMTSFVPPRFPKRRGGRELESAQSQLARLLVENYGSRLVKVAELPEPTEHWRAFEQRRSKQPQAPRRPASGWRIELDQELPGPLSLGWGAHFGLGCFEIDDEK